MEIIGHRGAAGLAPENTMKAFHKAVEIGCRKVELDVHLSRDGVPVVIHDMDVDRVSNGSGRVNCLKLKSLKNLVLDGKERIPTLEEVFKKFGDELEFQIELKEDGVVLPVVRLIKDCRVEVAVSSFHVERLMKVKEHIPDVRTVWLFKDSPDGLLDEAVSRQIEFVGIKASRVQKKIIEDARRLGIKTYVYHLNDRKKFARLKEWGVDAVGTDFPHLFLGA